MRPSLSQRLILALDTPDLHEALALVKKTRGVVGTYKVGLELFAAVGPAAVAAVRAEGGQVFLDAKLHDIPNTIAGAVRSASKHGADLVTVHASGGPAMLRAAQAAVGGTTRLLAVTALTHLTAEELGAAGFVGAPADVVRRLAALAVDAGVYGCVCSPQEAALVRAAVGPGLALVCPGIRSPDAPVSGDDQARTATALEAVRAGADYVVVGRPIRMAADPAEAAARFLEEIEQGLERR